LPPLQSLGDYNSSNTGLDFGGTQISNMISGMSSSGGILDAWRIPPSQQAQQFPFLINTTGLVQSSNALYPLLEGGVSATQTRNVKAEENDQDRGRDGDGVNNLSRNFLGNININSGRNEEYTSWGGNSSWTGFTSNNSTGHLSF
jgi:hypothetical protein